MKGKIAQNISETQYSQDVRRLRPLSAHVSMAIAQLGTASQEGRAACDRDVADKMSQMLMGIWQYQNHPLTRQKVRQNLPLERLWSEGQVSIQTVPDYDYAAGRPSLLLVPSMINKAYIFDLCEERSMLRWLCEQGINAYLLNWGAPEEDKAQANIESVILRRLIPAIQFLSAHSKKPIHALGYCMGGTLLTGAANFLDDKIKSITLLATPWDFHAGSQSLLNQVRFWAPSALMSLKEQSVLNSDLMQMIFIALDPAMSLEKFSKFGEMDQNSKAAHLFLAVEDWLNDSVNLPSEIARQSIQDWFLNNATMNGEWLVDGRVIRPEDINVPTLIIASDKDRLVEYDCASVLADKIEGATLVNPACGHIGMMAGKKAISNVWKPLAQWLQA